MRDNYSIKVPFGDGALLVSCDISVSHSVIDGYWINRVYVPPPLRDRRWGSQALDWLCLDADLEGVVLGLGISPYGRLNYTQLEAWYGRRRFVFTPYEDKHGQWTYYRRDPMPLYPAADWRVCSSCQRVYIRTRDRAVCPHERRTVDELRKYGYGHLITDAGRPEVSALSVVDVHVRDTAI